MYLPQEMQRAIARQAEAEAEREGHSPEGGFEASQCLADAADVIGWSPATLQLRDLQTLVEISAGKIPPQFFPFPSI